MFIVFFFWTTADIFHVLNIISALFSYPYHKVCTFFICFFFFNEPWNIKSQCVLNDSHVPGRSPLSQFNEGVIPVKPSAILHGCVT